MSHLAYFKIDKNKSAMSAELTVVVNFIGGKMCTAEQIRQHFEQKLAAEYFSVPVNLAKIKQYQTILDRLPVILLAAVSDEFLDYLTCAKL